MKKLLISALLLSVSIVSAQTTVNLLGNNNSGIIELEKSVDYFYAKGSMEYFFDDYGTLGTTIGFNAKNRFETLRFYSGIKLAFMYREGLHCTYGAETGLDVQITESMYIGANYQMIWREDLKFHGINYEPSWKGSAFLKIGFIL